MQIKSYINDNVPYPIVIFSRASTRLHFTVNFTALDMTDNTDDVVEVAQTPRLVLSPSSGDARLDALTQNMELELLVRNRVNFFLTTLLMITPGPVRSSIPQKV